MATLSTGSPRRCCWAWRTRSAFNLNCIKIMISGGRPANAGVQPIRCWRAGGRPTRWPVGAARGREWKRGAIRSRLRRWHVWLGWLVGLPFLFWTVSGLVMVAKPIEEVRGEHLIAEPKPISIAGPLVAPNVEGRQVIAVTLKPRADG